MQRLAIIIGQSLILEIIFMYKKICLFLISYLYCQLLYADGVALGATRLVYPTDKDQVTLKVYNSDKKGNYLIQSWISDENDRKVNDFIITPPLFVIKANSDSILKIIYTGDKKNLPDKQEKLYYLNSKVIPSLSEEEQNINNALLISTTTKIKMFIRPDSIKDDPLEAYLKLKCSYANNQVAVENPTPFYINLVSLSMNGKEISKYETIPPKSTHYVKTNIKGQSLSFNFINDYGVQVKSKQCHL